jgi:hypothetical protein
VPDATVQRFLISCFSIGEANPISRKSDAVFACQVECSGVAYDSESIPRPTSAKVAHRTAIRMGHRSHNSLRCGARRSAPLELIFTLSTHNAVILLAIRPAPTLAH